jgi:hypothetical protein
MSVHVDVVQNDWLAGEQRAVARVIAGKKLEIDSPDRPRWQPVVERALAELYAQDLEPEVLLHEVQRALQGSHLFATEPHDEGSCPYANRAPVKSQSVSSDRQPAQI